VAPNVKPWLRLWCGCLLLAKLQYHLFADDVHDLKHDLMNDVPQIVSTLADCASDVTAWCAAKRLQQNADKTEVMWLVAAAKLGKISPAGSSSSSCICFIDVQPVTVVRHLRVMIDAELSMRDHVL